MMYSRSDEHNCRIDDETQKEDAQYRHQFFMQHSRDGVKYRLLQLNNRMFWKDKVHNFCDMFM